MNRLFAISLIFFISCGNGKDPDSGAASTVRTGKEIYLENCAICHGEDGRLGSGGARDLSTSTLSRQMNVAIIRDGKGAMTPFGSLLSDEEINNVAIYIEELRKDD